MFLTLLAMLFLGERIHALSLDGARDRLRRRADHVGPHLTFGGSSLGVVVALGAAVFSAARDDDAAQHERQRRRAPITITFYFSRDE